MPTPTDLVTDLPADFEVFGQAVDTSMADLKGGTTGQILSKTTNTDMDFTWITNDVGDITAVNVTAPITGGGTSGAVTIGVSAASTAAAGVVQLSDSTSTTSSVLASTPTATKSAYDLANTASTTATAAIPKSTVTTAGDVIYATGSAAVTRLGVGTTGQVLTVAGGVPSWATPTASSTDVVYENPILNSAFQVWQRGTSVALAASTAWDNAFTADRWNLVTGASQACTIARTATSDTTNLAFIQYCARVQRNSGQTGTGVLNYTQVFETINTIPLAGKAVTVTFYARKGANYTAASDALVFSLVTGTGTDQQPAAFTGAATPVTGTATLTATWQRFTFTGTLAATATQLYLKTAYTPVGTASTNDYYEITGFQIDIGSTAFPFRTYALTYQAELAACQRYYWRGIQGIASGLFEIQGFGTGFSTTAAWIMLPALVRPMRSRPKSVDYANLRLNDAVNGYTVTSLTVNGAQSGQENALVVANVSSGLTQFRPYFLDINNSASGYIGINAEI